MTIAPGLQQVGVVGEVECQRRVLLDQQDADPARVSRSPRMMPKISRTTSGARPNDGSSRISRRGRSSSARAIASICCSPPESVPACWRRRSRSRGSSRTRARTPPRSLGAPGAYRRRAAGSPRRSSAGRCRGRRAPAPRRAGRCSRSAARRSARPPKRISPAVRTMPRIARKVVVLPAPLAPSSAVMPPSATARSIPCSTSVRAVAGTQPAHCEQRRHARLGRRDRRGSPRGRAAPPPADPSAILRPNSSATTRSETRHDQVHVMLDQQDAELEARPDGADQVGELVHLLVVEPARRLVEQEQRGLADAGRGPARPASGSRTAGWRRRCRRSSRRSISSSSGLEPLAERLPPRDARGGRPRQPATNPLRPRWCAPTRMLSRTVMVGNNARFWNVRPMPSAAMRCRGSAARSALPRSRISPAVAAVDVADAVEQRRLARAVRPDQAADLARRHVERHAIERRQPAEPDHDVAHLEQLSAGFDDDVPPGPSDLTWRGYLNLA